MCDNFIPGINIRKTLRKDILRINMSSYIYPRDKVIWLSRNLTQTMMNTQSKLINVWQGTPVMMHRYFNKLSLDVLKLSWQLLVILLFQALKINQFAMTAKLILVRGKPLNNAQYTYCHKQCMILTVALRFVLYALIWQCIKRRIIHCVHSFNLSNKLAISVTTFWDVSGLKKQTNLL